MEKRIVKVLSVIGLLFLMVSPLAAASAKVTYVKGKVEVQRKGAWVQLKTGDYVAEKETVSTGYQSEARFDLDGSILVLSAMSRVTIETLKTSPDKTQASVYVNSGSVRSKVKHTDNKKVDYQTRTAVAVASVRGTIYSMTSRGDSSCEDGFLDVCSLDDYRLNGDSNPGSNAVYPGQTSGLDDTGKTIAGENTALINQNRIADNGYTCAEQEAGENSDSESELTAMIILDVTVGSN